MAYLITHSLLSAWLYSMKENPFDDATQEDASREDFLRVLRREPTPTTDAMQNGIDFENLVTEICSSANPASNPNGAFTDSAKNNPWFPAAFTVAEYVYGGQFQYVATKRVTVDGTELLLYGRLDALRAGGIYDIKFSKGYERGKYFDSTQHPMYMELVPTADSFTYLVSNGTEVWTEKYRRDETPSIYPTVHHFLDWLKANSLLQLYREHWGERK